MTVPVHGLPSLVRPGLRVALVPPPLVGPRWYEVSRVGSSGRSGELVALAGVSTLGDAEKIVGAHLLAAAEDLPDDLVLLDRERLVGRTVLDEASGRAGTISEVLAGSANDVWVLRDGDDELLVPVAPGVVVSAPEGGTITVRAPRGLAWERGGGAA